MRKVKQDSEDDDHVRVDVNVSHGIDILSLSSLENAESETLIVSNNLQGSRCHQKLKTTKV